MKVLSNPEMAALLTSLAKNNESIGIEERIIAEMKI